MENSKIDKQTDVHTENRNKGAQKEVSIFAFGCYLSITVRVLPAAAALTVSVCIATSQA